jgi:hypothetical protein
MRKPTVYLDTSIISAFWYDGSDEAMAVRRARTRDWWKWERSHFDIWASRFVEAELRIGTFAGQSRCIAMIERLRYLTYSRQVSKLTHELLDLNIVPPSKEGDAAQLTITCVRESDYVLTWNYAHMANPIVQNRLTDLCKRLGLRAPMLVSPESIPQIRLGQSVRRD